MTCSSTDRDDRASGTVEVVRSVPIQPPHAANRHDAGCSRSWGNREVALGGHFRAWRGRMRAGTGGINFTLLVPTAGHFW